MSTAQDRRVGKTRTGTPFDQAMARPAKPKPSSTIEQKMTALGRAEEIRLARAELRHRLARGDVFAASVLLDVPDEARTWPLNKLLLSQRRWGPDRCRRFLGRLEIRENKEIGQLTERQRQLVAKALGQDGER